MQTHILSEGDWENFIQKEIFPLIIKSRIKSGMTTTSSGATTTSPDMTGAFVIGLVGDLGAGKTTFSKTLLHALGVFQHVQSPTFSIINSYDISSSTRSQIKCEMKAQGTEMICGEFEKVFHMDVYRIDDLKELQVLHIDEIFNNPKNIVVIEWADKIKTILPKNTQWIYFEHNTIETRNVTIEDQK